MQMRQWRRTNACSEKHQLPCLKSYDSQFNITPQNHEDTYAIFAITNLFHHLLTPPENKQHRKLEQTSKYPPALGFPTIQEWTNCRLCWRILQGINKLTENRKPRQPKYETGRNDTSQNYPRLKQPQIEQYARDSCQTEKKLRHVNMPRNQAICTPTPHGCRSQ